LLHVSEVMRSGDDLPRVTADTSLAAGLIEMSRKRLGLTAIVADDNRVIGVFTDGDLRRVLDRGVDLRSSMESIMTRNPRCIDSRELAAEAVNRMQQHGITALLVVDEKQYLVGALNIHDLLRAGVV
jgi:arabinose-5-phosphate isomerase